MSAAHELSRPAAPQGTLYVVGTPIGNLEDITLRALRVLREVALVAAEDTRRTRALLAHFDIPTPLLSYREQNRAASTPVILERLRSASVALVCDAGMPAISDPGADLIARVLAEGGRVEVVPGPSAVLMALIASGLPAAPFSFVGFLSRQRGDRLRQLQALSARTDTLVFFEAPHRLLVTLTELAEVFGDRPAAVCRELTKLHEETLRGSLAQMRDHFAAVAPRGEFTLVVQGARDMAASASAAVDVEARLRAAMAAGEEMRAVLAELARLSGRPRRELYALWQSLRRDAERPP